MICKYVFLLKYFYAIIKSLLNKINQKINIKSILSVNFILASLKITDWTPDYFIANQSNCNIILENLNILDEIPLLNNAPLHEFKDKQLVRFKGMIQDMHDPEYYLQQYEVKNNQTETFELKSGMYIDTAKCLVIIFILKFYFIKPFKIFFCPY